MPHDTPSNPPETPLNTPHMQHKALRLSRKVDECEPLVSGTFYIHAPPDAGRIVFHDPRWGLGFRV
jgi:hypothetical protein